MNENFLHHLWKLKLFVSRELRTTEGESIEIIKAGLHNTDAGPDFFNARIKIGNTTWAGNVEIHLKSSDWKNHAHEKDNAYDNVILHVVYVDDEDVKRKNGSAIPTLELNGKFDLSLWENYENLLNGIRWIPCEHRISGVEQFVVDNWLDRLLVERLENKTGLIHATLQLNNFNWEDAFYQQLAKNFGFRLNAVPFELLSKELSMSHLAKHKDHLLQLEAMLFGVSGMLEQEMKDDYPRVLQKEYAFLKNKFKLNEITAAWKFLRLRPQNFPTVRLAQFAQVVHRSSHLFSNILECDKLALLREFFDVSASGYWHTHFIFDTISVDKTKHLGKGAFHDIVINTIVPFLFMFGKIRGSEIHQHRALKFLREIPGENNFITRRWKSLGIESGSAYRSQALLQLKNEYCSEKKCLLCSVGDQLIRKVV